MMSKSTNILTLPDELLCVILKNLSTIDVFYTLVDVNERFHRLALDSLYVHHLDFVVEPLVKRSSTSIDDQVLEEICKRILPRISNVVYKLTVAPLFLEAVLGNGVYPRLHSLILVNFPEEKLLSQLRGDTLLVHLLNDQITQVRLVSYVKTGKSSARHRFEVFGMILSVSKQLCDLTLSQYILKNFSNLNLPNRNCTSSTLNKLHLSVHCFDDCLYLLDGRFECLSTLIIQITKRWKGLSDRENQRKLPRLKSFSLSLAWRTFSYDVEIVPLLCRMCNLEELTLFLPVSRINSSFLDGKQLHNDVLSSMTRLQKFTFSIRTQLIKDAIEMKLPSNDEIRNSFFQLGYKDIDAFADVDFLDQIAECHTYSVPYQFQIFDYMTSTFQGGQFDQVRILIMFDRRPFEHRLFQIIARDFPLLRKLLIVNCKEQQVKNHSDQLLRFNHLCELSLQESHLDYAKEFLCNTNIALPRLTSLSITYQALATVTRAFTDTQSALICKQIKRLWISEPFVRPNNFHLYFPLAHIVHLKK